MPTQFTIYIPTTFTMNINDLTINIQQQLLNKLSSSRYRDNFPIHINVKQWTQGMYRQYEIRNDVNTL